MTKKQLESRLREIESRMSLENRGGDLARARAVTVGTCFGGTTELMMRRNDGTVVWTPMQPVEVIELIYQLAANVGCHVLVKPRDDFASWRDWRVSPEEKKHLQGHPPFVNDMAPHQSKGQVLPPPDQQPGLALPPPKDSNETVATEKPSKRRRVKRAATAA